MPIIVESDGENLIFNDYLNRTIKIKQEDYLELIRDEERWNIRPALEECFSDPTEVWFNKENVEGKDYYYYKFIKLYSNLAFIAIILIDDLLRLTLNNFYGFDEDELNQVNEERKGQLILSKL